MLLFLGFRECGYIVSIKCLCVMYLDLGVREHIERM